MPSWWTYNIRFQSLIIFILYFNKIFSINNDTHHHHQVLKGDVGQDITMSCIFDQEKLEQVSFMRQMTGDILSVGSELFLDKSNIELKRFSSNRLDLKLISVNQNDSGIYTCMFNDEQLISFLIEIFVPPRFISYFPLESTLSYQQDSPVNLSCHAYAIPSVNITWIFKDKNKQTKNIYYGEELFISSIQPADSGLYECVAGNMYHASISRSFYVTVQYSPRVLIYNENIHNSVDDTIQVKCRICSTPQIDKIYWLREKRLISDENIQIKIKILNEECSEAIINIIDINEHQFGQYECRGENSLGEKSDYIYIEPISKIRKIKQKVLSEEINRNGRTALSATKSQKKRKNQTITITTTIETSRMILSNSITNQYSIWFLLILLINSLRLL